MKYMLYSTQKTCALMGLDMTMLDQFSAIVVNNELLFCYTFPQFSFG